jgi:hypothetical protein
MSRKSDEYGLPPLTFSEAARTLECEEAAFKVWLMEYLGRIGRRAGSKSWSHWETGEREIPEPYLRIYRMYQQGRQAEIKQPELSGALRPRSQRKGEQGTSVKRRRRG